MTDEEKKAKTKEYGDRYTAKDPERRREQKRLAQKRYYERNKEKAQASTRECDRKRKERDPEAFLAQARISGERYRRKKGQKKRSRMPEEERKQKAVDAHNEWKAENKELFKEIQRVSSAKYREKNPEKCAEQGRRWRQNNPEKVRERNRRTKHRRRMILENQPDIDLVKWKETLAGFEYKCVYCRDIATTVEHIVAVSCGGTNHHTNLLPACKRCNSSKWKHPLHKWVLKSKIAKEGLSRPWDWQPPEETSGN